MPPVIVMTARSSVPHKNGCVRIAAATAEMQGSGAGTLTSSTAAPAKPVAAAAASLFLPQKMVSRFCDSIAGTMVTAAIQSGSRLDAMLGQQPIQGHARDAQVARSARDVASGSLQTGDDGGALGIDA